MQLRLIKPRTSMRLSCLMRTSATSCSLPWPPPGLLVHPLLMLLLLGSKGGSLVGYALWSLEEDRSAAGGVWKCLEWPAPGCDSLRGCRHPFFLGSMKRKRAKSVQLTWGHLKKAPQALLTSRPGRFQKEDVYVSLDFLDLQETDIK